ncbi:MAG: sigma-70 family RNA polymerase sigma factor [Planctomycetes bacterium]|nr:sigma-70 family RNA polymerase sigma factor [Planctomycetota bacterium]
MLTIQVCEPSVSADRGVLDDLFDARTLRRLERMVAGRLGSSLRARLDASDVVQEACLEALRRLGKPGGRRSLPSEAWMRCIVLGKLTDTLRRHLRTFARDARREVPLEEARRTGTVEERAATREADGPPALLLRGEVSSALAKALDALGSLDREVVVLRVLGGLPHAEVARAVRRTESAVRKRYGRALRKLREIAGRDGWAA